MKFASIFFLASGVSAIQATASSAGPGPRQPMSTHFAGCSLKSIGAYNHCKEHNNGVSPCGSDSDCFVACGRAGSRDKSGDYRMVADYNGPSASAQCECRCFRKRERFPW
ncbi:hypothetical protein E6O75_ATG03705 [Venturia nashicola]|uniref:Uncharacterized protein n=1 Tax=Venturia nashicola TaxID=86259 RepID=A0A4Z1PS01_9PEZI|nr:hypothetical protein E6O75_ATG03705 [Venturia nashicola]